MAGANYNKVRLQTTGETVVVPALAANTYSVVTVSMVNMSSTQAKVRIAVTDTAGVATTGAVSYTHLTLPTNREV